MPGCHGNKLIREWFVKKYDDTKEKFTSPGKFLLVPSFQDSNQRHKNYSLHKSGPVEFKNEKSEDLPLFIFHDTSKRRMRHSTEKTMTTSIFYQLEENSTDSLLLPKFTVI